MKKFLFKKQKGFAMLFTVLIVTLILSIAISISTLSYKQTLLSSLAGDSQISFYQADTAVECGLYYDTKLGTFPKGTDPSSAQQDLVCGNDNFYLDMSQSSMDYLVFLEKVAVDSKACSSILFDKSSTPGVSIIQGRGYNVCNVSPRQVERALEVRY